jgi:hypothetical protein
MFGWANWWDGSPLEHLVRLFRHLRQDEAGSRSLKGPRKPTPKADLYQDSVPAAQVPARPFPQLATYCCCSSMAGGKTLWLFDGPRTSASDFRPTANNQCSHHPTTNKLNSNVREIPSLLKTENNYLRSFNKATNTPGQRKA